MTTIPRVPKVHRLNISANQQDIKTTVRDARFLPFLGAGASSLRPEKLDLGRSPWRETTVGLQRLGRHLLHEGAANPEAYKYLRSFVEQRLRLVGRDLAQVLPEAVGGGEAERSPEEGVAEGWPEESMLEFQASLCRLGGFLGKKFGHAFSTSYPSVDQLGQCKVRVELCDEEREEGFNYLWRVLSCALELPRVSRYPVRVARRPFEVRPPLRVKAVQRKLLTLAVELVPPSIWENERWIILRQRYKRFEPVPEDLPRAHEQWIEILLSMVQWISDLLWYTVRYWMPIYPTTSELAFELSLAAEQAPPRRAELAQAAEALFLSEKGLVAEMREILEYLEEVREEPPNFHLVMAAMLAEMFSKEKALAASASASGPSAGLPSDDSAREGTRITMAFTTNFDRALEKGLEALRITHHVLYPVVRGEEVDSNGGPGQRREEEDEGAGDLERVQGTGHVEWLLRTWAWEPVSDPPFNTLQKCDPEEKLPLGRRRLLGPVIVKLHGSPLEPVMKGYEHWIVLSESGYLRAMDLNASKVPKWVELELKSKKKPSQSLWFLGYSVSDWNIRLRLYEHVQATSGWSLAAEKSIVDFSRHLDLFRLAIFGSLDIAVFQGDLNVLARIVEQALSEDGRIRLESYRRP